VFDIPTKPLSLEEKSLYKIMETNVKSSKLSNEGRINVTIQIIKKHVIEKLRNVSAEDIENKFLVSHCKKKASEIFYVKKLDNVHIAIRQALMYNEAYKLLIGCENENSVDSHLISLQLYNLEQEQLIRLVNTCALLFKTSIIVKNASVITLEDIHGQLQSVQNSSKSQTRELFYNQFPEDWKIPVLRTKEIPNIEDLDVNCKNLMNRLQKLVFYNCKNNYIKIENNYELHSPALSLVQYVLPSLVSVYHKRDHHHSVNDLKILHCIILSYECELLGTIKIPDNIPLNHEKKRKIVVLGNQFIKKYHCDSMTEICDALFFYNTVILTCENTVNNKDVNNLNTFCNICNTMLEYFKDLTPINGKKSLNLISILSNIYAKVYNFSMVIFKVSVLVSEVPNPGISLQEYPKISQLYFLCMLNLQLKLICYINSKYCKDFVLTSDLRKLFSKLAKKVTIVVFKYCYLLHNKIMDHPLDAPLHELFNSQYLLYDKLKQFRKRTKVCPIFKNYLPLSNVFSEIKVATDYYLDGNFTALDNMMLIFKDKKVETVDYKVENTCRQCGKPESVRKLITCEECIKDQYPDIHYFCGRRCQEKRWKLDHFAEHLEFELGLSEFN
jgi:hypothetical protein